MSVWYTLSCMKTVVDIRRMSTRRLAQALTLMRNQQHNLLQILHETFAPHGVGDVTDTSWHASTVPAPLLGGAFDETSTVTVRQLKDELERRARRGSLQNAPGGSFLTKSDDASRRIYE